MKKAVLLFAGLVLSWSSVLWGADFEYGQDTYERWDDVLIVNSLGDKVAESKFKYGDVDLGYNDYVPENAFKNYLYSEGYTSLFDFDDPSLDLEAVGYMGRLGDPRSYDEDYVLRKEWEKYSSQYQDTRINNNATGVQSNKEDILNNSIKVKESDQKHTRWNEQQDLDILDNSMAVTRNSQMLSDHESRINKLEETQLNIVGELNVVRGRRHNISVYGKYNTNRHTCSEVGVRFTFSLGDSYEMKEIDRMDKRIKELEKLIR